MKLMVANLVKFPAFYETVFTIIRHWFLTSTTGIQSTPSHTIFLISMLILFSHLHLGLPSGQERTLLRGVGSYGEVVSICLFRPRYYCMDFDEI